MTRPGPERRQDAALTLAFVSLGAVSAAIPASLPAAATRLGVAAADLLPSVSLLFLGLFAGVVVVAVARRGSARTMLPVGSGLEAAGLIAVACAPSVPVFLGAALATGIGFGLVEASATALTRARSAHGTPARLSALNGASAVAAAGAPLLIVAGQGAPWAPLLAIALVPAGAAVTGTVVRTGWPGSPDGAPSRARGAGSGAGAGSGPGVRGRVTLLAVALFLFVGAETILAGWSSTLPAQLLDIAPAAAAAGTTVFWTLMAVGRFACTALLARGVRPAVYLPVAALVAAVLGSAGAAVGRGVGAALLVAAVVVCVAPGYALLMGCALAVTPPGGAARISSALVAVGAAGGSAISFVVAATVGAAPAAVLLVVSLLLAGCAVLSVLGVRRGGAVIPEDDESLRMVRPD
ncbi:hypothetical protein [Leifsonia sp. C5G2]|uniref:MFS transporter n=1 Tax=Leifsonia sp. C5G2 TaxID=2735269 RepID=UPI0015858FE9|nr:hypothetical protein [Leifsonia sp. C5G2]NUU05030.1 hypothetical protein [Leifsonia sp. C5G2]